MTRVPWPMPSPLALAVLALLLLTACAQAQDRGVVYRSGDPTLRGTLCRPPGPGPFAAVVYNHGGLGDIVGGAPQETCAALARSGFVGFAPIRRRTRPLHGHLDDVMAALAYVRGLAFVDADRVAMIGFSRGALLTLRAAAGGADLRAIVIMGTAAGRGGLDADLGDASAVAAPVLILVAENDRGSRRTMGRDTLAASRDLARALKAAGKKVRLIVYPPYGSDGHTLFFGVGDYWSDVAAFLGRHLSAVKPR